MLVSRKTKDVFKEGDTMYLPRLGATLREIQQDPYAMHNGSLAPKIVEDIQEHGGIITLEDMANYE